MLEIKTIYGALKDHIGIGSTKSSFMQAFINLMIIIMYKSSTSNKITKHASTYYIIIRVSLEYDLSPNT